MRITGATVHTCAFGVAAPEEVAAAAQRVESEIGPVEIVVNNTGRPEWTRPGRHRPVGLSAQLPDSARWVQPAWADRVGEGTADPSLYAGDPPVHRIRQRTFRRRCDTDESTMAWVVVSYLEWVQNLQAFTSTGVEVVRGLCVFMQNASRSHVIGVGQVARCTRRGGLFP
nr:hypothetical protein GCM10017611_47060 [Rhodococcus wratislaviensis]